LLLEWRILGRGIPRLRIILSSRVLRRCILYRSILLRRILADGAWGRRRPRLVLDLL
jgi:hypothetical protein